MEMESRTVYPIVHTPDSSTEAVRLPYLPAAIRRLVRQSPGLAWAPSLASDPSSAEQMAGIGK